MLKLLYLMHGKEYQIEVTIITLIVTRTDERHTYVNFVEEN